DDDMRMQNTFLAQRDVFADDAIRSDFAIGTNLRLGMNDGGGMNHALTNIKVISASLTTSPATLQIPLPLPILPRTFVSSISINNVSPGTTGLRHLTSSADMKKAILLG